MLSLDLYLYTVSNNAPNDIMRANTKQLQSLESLKKNFGLLSVGEYGFYSDGSIGVLCTDSFGEFCTTIDLKGIMSSR